MALSTDGSTAVVGAPADRAYHGAVYVGAVWVYVPVAPFATPVAVPAMQSMLILMLGAALLMLGLWRVRTNAATSRKRDRRKI